MSTHVVVSLAGMTNFLQDCCHSGSVMDLPYSYVLEVGRDLPVRLRAALQCLFVNVKQRV